VTTHTLTSLDPVPIATSQLMDSIGGGSRDGSLLLDDERKQSAKYSLQSMEDVICLPLTIDMKIFCLERLSQVLTANIDRIQVVWNLIMEHCESLIVAQQRNALKHKPSDDSERAASATPATATAAMTYVLPSESESDALRHSHYFFERITVNILKLCVELTEMEISNKLESVSTFLNLFLTLDDSIIFVIGRRVIAGIKLLLNLQSANYEKYVRKQQRKLTDLSTTATAYYGQCFKQEKDWKIVCFLMKRFAHASGVGGGGGGGDNKQCVLEAFQVIELISKSHLEITNFNYVLHVLTAFGKHAIEAPVHNTRVIEVILSIHSRLVLISHQNETVLAQMWHKTLSNISTFGTNSDYITRRFAINCLHKALLQYPIEISNKHSFVEPLKLLFQTVLFPLLLQLTKIENERIAMNKFAVKNNEEMSEQLHGSGNEENTDDLRLKLLTLIFQLWLHDMNILLDYDTGNFHTLWYNFLTTIRKFIFMVNKMQRNNSNLVLHCCESLKNVILVFQASNVFQTLADKTENDVWKDTWAILGDCAPNLKQEFVQ